MAAHKLSPYRLTEIQWNLAEELVEVLMIFDEPTRLFSQAEVPLIPDVIPMLCDMKAAFINIRDAPLPMASNSVRVASQAALLLINKYFTLTEESELYQIAMGKFPNINSILN